MALTKYKLGELIKQRREKYDGLEELPIKEGAKIVLTAFGSGLNARFTAVEW